MQVATTPPVLLQARRESMKSEGFLKLPPRINAKSLGQRLDATSTCSKASNCEDPVGVSDVAESAGLRDHSSKIRRAGHGATCSSQTTKRFIDLQNKSQNYNGQHEPWQTQKRALSEKLGSAGWLPRKRLSPDTLKGIRALHGQYPDRFTTPILADQFKVSPEAIRRILKSKWRPTNEEEERRRRRWEKRGENLWSQMVEMGIKPPRRWRDKGVGGSSERDPAPEEQLESRIKFNIKTPSQRDQSTAIAAHRNESGSPMLLADRII